MNRDPLSDLERVRRAAATLSPLERDVLVLSAELGLSNGAIAARLGISERRAERRLARALLKFDRALEQGGSSPWWSRLRVGGRDCERK